MRFIYTISGESVKGEGETDACTDGQATGRPPHISKVFFTQPKNNPPLEMNKPDHIKVLEGRTHTEGLSDELYNNTRERLLEGISSDTPQFQNMRCCLQRQAGLYTQEDTDKLNVEIDEFVQQSQLSESATTVKRRRQMGLAWMSSVLLRDGTVADD